MQGRPGPGRRRTAPSWTAGRAATWPAPPAGPTTRRRDQAALRRLARRSATAPSSRATLGAVTKRGRRPRERGVHGQLGSCRGRRAVAVRRHAAAGAHPGRLGRAVGPADLHPKLTAAGLASLKVEHVLPERAALQDAAGAPLFAQDRRGHRRRAAEQGDRPAGAGRDARRRARDRRGRHRRRREEGLAERVRHGDHAAPGGLREGPRADPRAARHGVPGGPAAARAQPDVRPAAARPDRAGHRGRAQGGRRRLRRRRPARRLRPAAGAERPAHRHAGAADLDLDRSAHRAARPGRQRGPHHAGPLGADRRRQRGRDPPKPAALVAIRPSTGAILAVADNAQVPFEIGLDGRFPAGSTFKILTSTALLQAKVVQPASMVDCPGHHGRLRQGVPERGQVRPRPDPLRTAFAQSCNTTFTGLSQRLDTARWPRPPRCTGSASSGS